MPGISEMICCELLRFVVISLRDYLGNYDRVELDFFLIPIYRYGSLFSRFSGRHVWLQRFFHTTSETGAVVAYLIADSPYRATRCVNAVFAVARCQSVRPSVRSSGCPSVRPLRSCIQTAEDVVKLLSLPGSPVILVSDC